MKCHQPFDGQCVRCLQIKVIELTDLAERVTHTAERVRAEYEQLEMIVAELREENARLEGLVAFHTESRW